MTTAKKSSLIPVITETDPNKDGIVNSHIVFSYLTKIETDTDLWTEFEDICDFVTQAYQSYYQTYTSVQILSRGTRQVSPKAIAEMFISKAIRSNNKGNIRFNIICVVRKGEENVTFNYERVDHQIQYCDTTPVGLEYFIPVGFQTSTFASQIRSEYLVRVAFDLRVQSRDIVESLEYFKEKAIPDLNYYYTFLKEVYKNISTEETRIDFEEVSSVLEQAIESNYVRRLHQPDFNERSVVFLDAVFVRLGPDEETAKHHMSVHVNERVSVTKTPEIDISDTGYVEELLNDKVVLRVFNPISESIPVTKQPDDERSSDT